MSDTLPDFAIVGAQKAASTLIVECLRQHPEVWLPRGEDDFFRDPVYGSRTLEDLSSRYRRHVHGHRRFGIKCPDYLARAEVAERLHRDLDNPQIIVMLRDPVSRAVSAYFWRMKWGFFPVMPLEEGLERILDGQLRDHDPTVGEVLEWGLYHEHLSRYLQIFGRDRVHISFDDDLRQDTLGTVRSVFRFLGVDESVEPPASRRRQLEGVYSLDRLRFLDKRNRYVLHWDPQRTYATIPRPTRPWPFAYNAAVVLIDRHVLRRRYGNERPSLSPGLRSRLVDYYAKDIQQLEALLGRDLSAWRTGTRSPATNLDVNR